AKNNIIAFPIHSRSRTAAVQHHWHAAADRNFLDDSFCRSYEVAEYNRCAIGRKNRFRRLKTFSVGSWNWLGFRFRNGPQIESLVSAIDDLAAIRRNANRSPEG